MPIQAIRPSDGRFSFGRLHRGWRRPIAILVLALALTSCSDEQPSAVAPADPVPAAPATAELPTPADTPPTTPALATAAEEATEVAPASPEAVPPDATVSDRAAQQFEVRGVVTQWAPMVTFVQPGDSVVFKQMTGHDTETIEGMVPEGGVTWKSALGQEGYSVTLDVPGAYVYKCNPHVSTGMIGVIVVGEPPPANLEQIKASPLNKGMIGRAIRKLDEALAAH